jgi:hypothetical protein
MYGGRCWSTLRFRAGFFDAPLRQKCVEARSYIEAVRTYSTHAALSFRKYLGSSHRIDAPRRRMHTNMRRNGSDSARGALNSRSHSPAVARMPSSCASNSRNHPPRFILFFGQGLRRKGHPPRRSSERGPSLLDRLMSSNISQKVNTFYRVRKPSPR